MGKLLTALSGAGIALDIQKRQQVLRLEVEFEDLKAERDTLKAENLHLKAQVEPLKRTVERLKNRLKEQAAKFEAGQDAQSKIDAAYKKANKGVV